MRDCEQPALWIILVLLAACGGTNRARVPKPPPPLAPAPIVDPEVDPETFSTWSSIESAVVRVQGQPRIAIVLRGPLGESPAIAEKSRKIMIGELADRVKELANRAGGINLGPLRVFEPTKTHEERGTFNALLLCDAQCFETYASEPTSEFFDKVVERLRASNPVVGPEVARARNYELTFADTSSARWPEGSGPWWIALEHELVLYDGVPALIAVGSGAPGTGSCMGAGSPAATPEAEQRLSEGFAVRVLGRPPGGKMLSVLYARKYSVDYDGRCRVLLVCRTDCLERSAELIGEKLPAKIAITYE